MDDALRLALQSGLPFSGLRGFEVDPRLLHYVPLKHAREALVAPMILIGNALKVASATPDPDLAPVRDHFPNLTVEIVIAPAAEIDAALGRVQGACR